MGSHNPIALLYYCMYGLSVLEKVRGTYDYFDYAEVVFLSNRDIFVFMYLLNLFVKISMLLIYQDVILAERNVFSFRINPM